MIIFSSRLSINTKNSRKIDTYAKSVLVIIDKFWLCNGRVQAYIWSHFGICYACTQMVSQERSLSVRICKGIPLYLATQQRNTYGPVINARLEISRPEFKRRDWIYFRFSVVNRVSTTQSGSRYIASFSFSLCFKQSHDWYRSHVHSLHSYSPLIVL